MNTDKKNLLGVALLALAPMAMSQQPPTGGGLIPAPVSPSPQRPAPEVRIEPRATGVPSDAAQPTIALRGVRVTGAQLYSERELVALTRFVPGADVSLADLQAMAARITEHYRRAGYFAAQAFLPAQDIQDGVVTIAVSEGRLGQLQLRNRSTLADSVALSAVDGLNPGEVLATPAMESRLLLLSDLPGVAVRSTLVPGASVGTSDLIVDIDPGRRITGSVDADNAGNRYTGAYRIGATVNVNNPSGLGDVFTLRGLTSGPGLRYARASYQLQLGRSQAGIAYSRLDYQLGKEFASLRAHGTAVILSVFGRYPVLRSRNDNVYLQLALDAKTFDDRVDSIAALTERKSRVLMASVYGDHRDSLGGGGVNSYFLTWSAGQVDIRTPAARALDDLTARTNGSFHKLSFSLMRLQRIAGPFSLYAGINGQLASKNLDVSEKMQLGGMNAVRAYPEGEAYADQGYVLNLEARMDLPRFESVPGQWQLVAFADTGSVTHNRNPWAAADNDRTLSGAGVGVNWADTGNFLVRAFYARPLGNAVATSSPHRSGRVWLQMVKYF